MNEDYMKEDMKLIRLDSDVIFKMFFKGGDTCLLKSLLANFLPLPKNSTIKRVEIMDSEIPPRERVKGKRMVLDIRIQVQRKEKDHIRDEMVDVEMQTTTQGNFTDRILAYASRMYSEQIDRGEHYENLRRVYSLVFTTTNLSEFAVKELEKVFYHTCSIQRNRPPHVVLTKGMQFVVVELDKFRKNSDKLIDKKEAWSYLLKESENMGRKDCSLIAEKGDDMAAAVKRLWNLSKDELAREYLRAEDKQRRDRKAELAYHRKEAIKQGMEEGREMEKRQVALKMICAGFSLHDISACTELSLDRLEELKKSQPSK